MIKPTRENSLNLICSSSLQEIFNPFPTIAVWAAVKFVHKREVVPSTGNVHHQFAFLPLISDPDSQVII